MFRGGFEIAVETCDTLLTSVFDFISDKDQAAKTEPFAAEYFLHK